MHKTNFFYVIYSCKCIINNFMCICMCTAYACWNMKEKRHCCFYNLWKLFCFIINKEQLLWEQVSLNPPKHQITPSKQQLTSNISSKHLFIFLKCYLKPNRCSFMLVHCVLTDTMSGLKISKCSNKWAHKCCRSSLSVLVNQCLQIKLSSEVLPQTGRKHNCVFSTTLQHAAPSECI